MNVEQAELIRDLLSNAGYLDDADEMFGDMIDDSSVEHTLAYAQQMDTLIVDLNAVLPETSQIHLSETMVELVNSLV